MNILNESTSIVMVGSWNQQILTPKWLKDNEITNQEKIQVEASKANLIKIPETGKLPI